MNEANHHMKTTQGDILVVDDTPNNLHLLHKMLSDKGYEVRTVINGEMAIKAAKADPPDLILLDINMPKMNGYQVCSSLKAIEQTSEIPVIFLSALDGVFDKVKAFSVGGVDYITKPFQWPEVLARIQNQLTMRNLRQQLMAQNAKLQEEIRERKFAQKKLSESERTLSTLMSNLPGIAYRSSSKAHWQLQFVSQGCYHLTGYPREDLINSKKVSYTNLIHQEDFKTISEEVQTAIASRQPFQLTYRITTEKGELKWVWEQGRGVFSSSGELLAIEGFITDITPQKRSEAALQQANQELARLATSDGLTKVANRRRFDQYLKQEWLRLSREQKPISLILCDVDYFKLYNDTYGHQMGDDCLVQVAEAINSATKRSGDLVARYGGEEFAVILPDVNSFGAMHVAKSIQEEIKKRKITHAGSTVSELVTLSMGVVTTVPKYQLSPDILVSMSDRLLYQVKQQGRNCIKAKNVTNLPESC